MTPEKKHELPLPEEEGEGSAKRRRTTSHQEEAPAAAPEGEMHAPEGGEARLAHTQRVDTAGIKQ